jgi:hypothetical protein
VAEHLPPRVARRRAQSTPYTLALFGTPGAGKGALVSELTRYWSSTGVATVRSDLHFDLSALSLASFETELVTRLNACNTGGLPTVVFVDELNKSDDNVYARLLQFLLPTRPLNALAPTVDRQNIVWIFAGTLGATPSAALGALRARDAQTGARDFVDRLDADNIPSLPDLTDPFERLIRYVMVTIRRDAPATARRISSELLLWCATHPIQEARSVDRHIFYGLGQMKARGATDLRLRDVLSDVEIAQYFAIYGDHVQRLREPFIELTSLPA